MPSQPPESRNQIPWNCQVLSGCRLQSETQVMVNTVCQLDWAAGCPHSWLNLISGNVSKSVYALELVSWVKQAGVPTEAQRESVGGGLNYLFLPGGRAENSGLMLPLGWACNTGSSGGYSGLCSRTGSWVPQPTDSRWWVCSALTVCEPSPYSKFHVDIEIQIQIHPMGSVDSVSLENPG